MVHCKFWSGHTGIIQAQICFTWAGQGLEGRFKMDQICFTSTFHDDHCQKKLDQKSEWIMFCFGHPGVVIVRLFQTRTPATGRIMTNTWRSDLMISWHHDFDVSSRMSKGRFFFNHNWMEGFQSWLESHPAKHAAGNITVMTCAWTRLLAQKY